MAILIDIVSHLPVVHNLAVGRIGPVQVVHGILREGSGPWAGHCRVCEGAVVPVYTCVAHANNLTSAIQACIRPISLLQITYHCMLYTYDMHVLCFWATVRAGQ